MQTPAGGSAGVATKVCPGKDVTSSATPPFSQAPIDLALAALAYAQRGIHVLPVRPRDKRPATDHGLRDATTDLAIIADWWRQWPNANIGVAAGAVSGVWVLDIDGEAGEQSLIDLIDANGALPETLTVATPRGGRHYWFAWPPELDVRNSAGKLGAGIDVRGRGGYALVPPSIGANDVAYTWVIKTAPVPAPNWLLTLVAPPPKPAPIQRSYRVYRTLDAYVGAAVNGELAKLGNAREGSRNHALNSAAYALGGFVKADVLDENWCRAALAEKALAIGLSLGETRATINSAFSAAQPRELPRARP